MNRSGYLSSSRDDFQDVGTLWTMRRHEHSARCVLLAGRSGWELRVLIDLALLLRERCPRTDDAFLTAERWKRQMLHDGWQQVVPVREEMPPTRGAGRRRPRRARATTIPRS